MHPEHMTPCAVKGDMLRRALRTFPTGVAVVATRDPAYARDAAHTPHAYAAVSGARRATSSRRLVAGLLAGAVFLIASLGLLTQPSSASAAYVAHAEWHDGPDVPFGPRLSITPTWGGRAFGSSNPGGVASEALIKSGQWQWNRTMYYQLVCHLNFAPWKPQWNLEWARPDVGYWGTVFAQCNPGSGPD